MTTGNSPAVTNVTAPCGADQFKAGMRRLASGVTLITSVYEGKRAGLIATAVSSVSTTPPTLLICVNRSASAHDVIDGSGSFAVNLIAASDLYLVDVFSKPALREQRFKAGDWTTLASGTPILATSLASFDCKIVHRLAYESHTIFLGEVNMVRIADGHDDALLYMDSTFRRLVRAA